MKRWVSALGFLISAVFIYLALGGLQVGQVWRVVQGADYRWMVPGMLVYFVGVLARTWRWHYMLRSLKVISLGRLFPVMVIGYMGNNIYPARAGEVIRAYLLRNREAVSVSASLATILVERVLDGLVMLLFILTSLLLAPLAPWLRRIVTLASPLFVGALVLFWALAAAPQRVQVIAHWIIDRLSALSERLFSVSLREPGRSIVARFLGGLHFLRSGRELGWVLGISVLVWLVETAAYWCVMQGFAFRVPFYGLMLMNGVVNLATIVPSSPGYIGTFDAPGIRVLSELGVSAQTAAGYTLVLHALLWLPITLLGFYYMWRESVSWRELSRASEATA